MLRGAHLARTFSRGARQGDCSNREPAAEAKYHDGADVPASGGDAVSEVADSARSPAAPKS